MTTKLWNADHGPGVEAALRRSLRHLGLACVDLYLIHCPFTNTAGPTLEPPLADTWRELERMRGLGLARSIGVSNFSLAKIDALPSAPAVNQVEMHPFLRQDALLAGCRDRGIHVTAYSPLGSGDSARMMNHDGAALLADAALRRVAGASRCTPAQALLRWGLARGTSVLPKSATPSRIAENYAAAATRLRDAAALDALEPQRRLLDMASCVHPSGPYASVAAFWDE